MAGGRAAADADNDYLSMVVQDDLAYRNKATCRYAQFVDGGITDNLGLRALLDAGNSRVVPRKYLRTLGIAAPRRIAIISVNAAADTPAGIGESNRAPSFEQTMNAVTNVQLDRYNVSTLQQTQQGLSAGRANSRRRNGP